MKDEEKTKEQLIQELAALRQSVIELETSAAQHQQLQETLRQHTERERLVVEITQRIRQTLNLEEVLRTTVSEVRQFLQTERVFIYRFEPDWSGIVVVESVDSQYSSILRTQIKDTYFAETFGRKLYQSGRIQATADIHIASLSRCHTDLLTQFQVRANLVVPILQPDDLWGLLIAHHCSAPRNWQHLEIDLLKQVAAHVAIAIQHSELYQQLQTELRDRQRFEAQLLHNAFYDALTGLPNRALFMERLGHALEQLKRKEDYAFAVLFLDLDRFKVVNDSMGHVFGDQLLIAIARRLKASLRYGDTIARIGGDEFTILLEDLEDMNDAINLAERIQAELTLPFNLDGQEVFTSVSIGIALNTTGYKKPEEVLRDANNAMYRAKHLGKARYEIFDSDMHYKAVALLQLETDLRRAIERQEFRVYYQPIVSLSTGRITGFEALVRWQHPQNGLVLPGEFMPTAIETELSIPIDEWLMREACLQTKQWQQLTPNPAVLGTEKLTIAINICRPRFKQDHLLQQISQTLQQTSLDANSLKLEITENVMMEHGKGVTQKLNCLRNLGIGLEIDDFGTGYSSLARLQRFPITGLKIDRSFISGNDIYQRNTVVTETIVTLAKKLGVQVTAEGVETAEQVAFVRGLNCEFGQGYFFCRPLDSEAATALILTAPQW